MRTGLSSSALVAAIVLASTSSARAETKCDLTFHLEGWSAFYKTAHGGGRITCNNGQSAPIVIDTKGGGITFGKMKIVEGHGEFSPVDSINELFGDYASAEAHAGAGKSTDAQVVTKGTVSLALTGEGRGVDVGFAFGRFSIGRARVRHHADTTHHRDAEVRPHAEDDRVPAPDDDVPRHADPPPPGSAY